MWKTRTIPGMFATCALDKTVTIWDTYSQGKPSHSAPHPCGNKDMGVGKLYTLSFYPSSPWLLGCGGGGKEVALWDCSSEVALQNRFGSRIGEAPQEKVQQDDAPRTEDFEAMMAAGDSVMDKLRKDKSKDKKKAHKKGRR